jgi:molybdopterin/thiamine biosynthesis adenylyltransferase
MSIDSATISLGFPRTPRSATVADPSGGIRAVLDLLDGTRNLDELAGALVGRVDRPDIESLVSALAAEGFLEDVAADPPGELCPVERGRYSRNCEFFSYFTDRSIGSPPTNRFSPQLALRTTSVVVMGVGGLGSHVALHLAALGVGRLILVDFDTVDASNLNRQLLFTQSDVGQPKVTVAARRLSEVNPFVDVVPTQATVRSIDDAAGWLSAGDLLICAADRPRVDLDRWINTAALELGHPWMRGASVGLTAVLDLFVPGRTACAECRLQAAGDGSTSQQELVDQIRSLGDGAISPCISPVAGLLGSLAALEAMKFLTGICPTALLDSQIVIDLVDAQTHHFPDPVHPLCPACSAQAPSAVW